MLESKKRLNLAEKIPSEYKIVHCSQCGRLTKHKLSGIAHYDDGDIEWWGHCLACGSVNSKVRRSAAVKRKAKQGVLA